MEFYIVLFMLFTFILALYLFYHLYLYLVTDGRYHLYKYRPFPQRYRDYLERWFPFYNLLPRELKRNFHACVLTFMEEKEFIGVGIEVDDYKKLLIAANACLLTAGRDRCEYKHVHTIILYPEAVVKREQIVTGYVVSEENRVLLGEAWQGGAVVLSWRDLILGDLNPRDGRNVGFHEFAHQLDMEDGFPDGTPELPWRLYPLWSQVMEREYKKIERLYREGKRSVLDRYGITSPAEFFAVATEAFFEKPRRLKEEEPELYTLLELYYRVDPAQWEGETTSS
ncbi:MAG: zinc-dependent peptidase [Epsilonproteobacteria bacterium]|nr:hypothetical protein [Campylobacterota bacterium]NPA57044.1 zinc-dependent peptidase [Campylobacterota bacterium]